MDLQVPIRDLTSDLTLCTMPAEVIQSISFQAFLIYSPEECYHSTVTLHEHVILGERTISVMSLVSQYWSTTACYTVLLSPEAPPTAAWESRGANNRLPQLLDGRKGHSMGSLLLFRQICTCRQKWADTLRQAQRPGRRTPAACGKWSP